MVFPERGFFWFAGYQNGNISIKILIVFDRILNDVKQYELIQVPIRKHHDPGLNLISQINIDPPLVDIVLERPEHISDGFFHGTASRDPNIKLILFNLHSADQVGIVEPHGFRRLLNACYLLKTDLRGNALMDDARKLV
jgi:hypothetical protein